ncbi:hypothetical protein AN401_07650 [Zobellella denitrificans]|uniref:DUF3179 domain-containing protein n=2 Tax=Zobellella denitrificans TaxID=347534 RepID=A0A291HUK4_9GAMM|nr:hypothetical protein AN401_07650 [Zobellella denitrificans]
MPRPAAAQGPYLNGFDLAGALVPVAEILRGGPPRDGIPAIDRPRFLSADEADQMLGPEEEVIGVVHNGAARAYPVAILNWHEVVNDRFGDQAVAVTYCPLCATATVLVAESEGQSLAFGVSGLLYNSNVLLYDRQTESLWSQVLAEAVTGPMKGRVLRTLPLTLTSWQAWRRAHPHSLVLSADTGHLRDYGRDPYREYARRNQLMFPVREQSRALPLKEMVTGLILNGEARAYPHAALREHQGPLHDSLGGQVIRIVVEPGGQPRFFEENGTELAGQPGYWFAWYAFYPHTEVWQAGK